MGIKAGVVREIFMEISAWRALEGSSKQRKRQALIEEGHAIVVSKAA